VTRVSVTGRAPDFVLLSVTFLDGAGRPVVDVQKEEVLVLEGELTLVTDEGETLLGPGMAAGFPAGVEDGHHLLNHSDATATYLEVGSRRPQDVVRYPDIDLMAESGPGGRVFTNKQGEPY
jgi:uncharacterized cupin superfamily protein